MNIFLTQNYRKKMITFNKKAIDKVRRDFFLCLLFTS